MMAHGVPIADLRLKEHAPKKPEILTVAAPYRVDLMKHAGESVVYNAGDEAAVLQGISKGGERKNLFKQLSEAENAVIVAGGFALANAEAADAIKKLAADTGAKIMLLGPMANSYGLESLDVLPNDSAQSYRELTQGKVKALILSGLDPAQDASLKDSLERLELLVVHDLFENATTELAHVVLPAKSGYEKDGTVVNLEGRYLSVNAAPVDSGQSEDFTGVVKQLGDALGQRLNGRSVRSARRELKKTLDMDLNEVALEGVLKAGQPSDKAVLSDKASEGNTLIVPSMLRPEFITRNPHLRAAHGDAKLRVHPEDASANNLTNNDLIRVNVGGFTRLLSVQVTDAVNQGQMLVPALPDQPVGRAELDLSSVQKENIALEVA